MSENKKNSKFKLSPWAIYGVVIGVFLLINIFSNGMDFGSPKPTTLSKFYQYLDSNQVEKVVFTNTKANIYLKKSALKGKEHNKAKDDVLGS